MTLSVAGKSVTRRDLREKLTGQVMRSPHPHADNLNIDTSQAAQLVKRAVAELLDR